MTNERLAAAAAYANPMNRMQPSTGGAPEKQVVSDIKLYMAITGWRVLNIEQQQRMRGGTPDMLAAKGGRAIWIEAKRRGGPWIDQRGRTCNLRAGEQRPKQRTFQESWHGVLPYILARSWEDVANELVKLGWD